jgi:hypothetical protein
MMRQSSVHTLRPKKGGHLEGDEAPGSGEENASTPVSSAAVAISETTSTKATDNILKEITVVLEAAGIGENDVWEGSIEVFPIVKHYAALIEAASTTHSETIVNFLFPKQPEFKGISGKTYKIDRRWTISQILNMICKKLEISTPKKYNVTTLRGFTFNENDDLGSYGLGSLLPSWQLKVVKQQTRGLSRITTLSKFDPRTGLGRKGEEDEEPAAPAGEAAPPVKLPEALEATTKTQSDKRKGKRSKKAAAEPKPAQTTATAASETPAEPVEERFPVLFIFESVEFPFKTQRVMLRPGMTVTQVIESLCRAYGVLNAWRFQLQTLGKQVLHGDAFMSDFGLGHRFKRWQVRLAVKADPTGVSSVLQEVPATKHAWVQFSESNLQMDEARRIILELDAKIERLKKKAALATPAVIQEHADNTAQSATEAALAAALGGIGPTSDPTPTATPRTKEKKSSRREETSKLKKEVSGLKAQLKLMETENKQLKEDLAAEKSRSAREIEKAKTTERKVAIERDSAQTVRHKEKELYEKKIKALEGNINETLRIVGTSSSSSHQRKSSIFEVFGTPAEKTAAAPDAAPDASANAGAAEDEAPSALIQSKLALEKAKLDLENFKLEVEQMRVTHSAEMEAAQGEVKLYMEKLEDALSTQQQLEEMVASLTVEVTDLTKARDEALASAMEREHHVLDLQKQFEDLQDELKSSEEEKAEEIKAQLKSQFEKDYLALLETNKDLVQQVHDSDEIIESLRTAVQELLDAQDDEPGNAMGDEGVDSDPVDSTPPPAAPTPPPPPPPAPAPPPPAPAIPKIKAITLSESVDVEEADLALASAAAPEQASSNMFEEMMSARNKLKKAGPSDKRNYHSDLQIALQKRFVAMNLDDYEDLEDEEEELNPDFEDSEDSGEDSDTESTSSSVSEQSVVDDRDEILFGLQL